MPKPKPKLFTPTAAASYLRDRSVQLSPQRLRELDAELDPVRIEDGRTGLRAYRVDSLDALVERRTTKRGAP